MGGDDFNKSNINSRNTGKSIDELKRIVNEKRNSESTDRAEQVNAMFWRILQTGDIENKIMEKMRNNLVNTVEDLSPYENITTRELKQLLRSRGLLDSGLSHELIERLSQSDKNHIKIPLSKTSIWSNGRSKEHLDLMDSLDEISERLYYDDICIRLEKYTDGVKCELDSIPYEEELILTVSW